MNIALMCQICGNNKHSECYGRECAKCGNKLMARVETKEVSYNPFKKEFTWILKEVD